MSAKGIRAGRAYVELGTDDSRFAAGLKSAQAKLMSWGAGLAKVGGVISGAAAAITGPLMGAVWAASSAGDELSKMADRTGASVEALSELQHAASQSDVEFDALGKGIHKSQRLLAEARTGNKAAIASFAALGLSVDGLAKMSPDQQFEAIAQAISELTDPAFRTAAAMEVFGKGGADLLPLMTDGAAGIQALRKEAKALGLQVSGKDAAAATLFGDTWANVKDSAMAAFRTLGYALLPTLTELMQKILPLIATAQNWINQNRELVVSVYQIAKRVAMVGTVVAGVGTAMMALSITIGSLLSVGAALGAIFGALLSPLGMLVAGVVAGGAALLAFTVDGQAVIEWFGSNFGKLATVVQNTVGGMFAAFQNGKLDVAAQIAMTGVQLAIATVMESVLGAFGLSIDDMMAMLAGLWKRISEVLASLNVVRQEAVNTISSALAALGAGSGDDERGRELERQRLEIMAQKGIETTGNDTSVANSLNGIQQQDMQTALKGLSEAEAMDPEAIGKEWAAAWDVERLTAELEKLNAAAREPQPVVIEDLNVPGLPGAQSDVEEGTAAAATNTASSAGSFSAFARFAFAGGGVQQRQLTYLQQIAKNTNPRNDQGGMVGG